MKIPIYHCKRERERGKKTESAQSDDQMHELRRVTSTRYCNDASLNHIRKRTSSWGKKSKNNPSRIRIMKQHLQIRERPLHQFRFHDYFIITMYFQTRTNQFIFSFTYWKDGSRFHWSYFSIIENNFHYYPKEPGLIKNLKEE